MTKEELKELDRLSRDESEWVRLRVAKNPSCPIEVLVSLVSDEHRDVREAATQSLRSRKETATPEELSRIEEMLSLLELGIRFDDETLDLSKIDI